MDSKTIETTVAALDDLPARDPEAAHSKADAILLTVVPQEVVDAYDRVVARARWWAYA